MKRIQTWIVYSAAIIVSGCASPGLYDWGSYESSIERMYVNSERFDLVSEIERLTAEVKRSESEHLRVPPGKYAHLGYLYYLSGDKIAAARFFEAEKRAFPESSVFVDGMLERMQ